MDLQNQLNVHIKQKANQYTGQSYSECVWCVFLQDFTRHVDSKIAPKTRAIVSIDMLFYMNDACMSHCTFKWNILCFLIEVCILFTTKPCSIHTKRTLNTIGQCIGWLSVWYAHLIDFEDPITICLEFVVWKFQPARWSEVSRCLENDSKQWCSSKIGINIVEFRFVFLSQIFQRLFFNNMTISKYV